MLKTTLFVIESLHLCSKPSKDKISKGDKPSFRSDQQRIISCLTPISASNTHWLFCFIYVSFIILHYLISVRTTNIKLNVDIWEFFSNFIQEVINSYDEQLKQQPMKYFSERLRNARKMNGLSLQELSNKLNNQISKQDLNRLETGIQLPDSKIISSLANVLNVTMDYFFKEQLLTLDRVEFRKLTKLPVKEQERIKGRTSDFLERYFELENLLGNAKEAPFKYQCFKINKANYKNDIEDAATKMRTSVLKIGSDPIYNIVELLEENGIKVFSIESELSFSGMSTCINNSTMVVVFNDLSSIPLVRKRFTLLHELAHLYLDLSDFDEKQSEKICDAFAGALLLPSEKLIEYFGGKRTTVFINELRNIKEYYGISLSAIMYRAMALDLVSEHYHRYFMILYNQTYKKQEGEGYKGKEESKRFIQLLMRAVAQEIISTTKAASLNNQKLGDFREQFLDASAN